MKMKVFAEGVPKGQVFVYNVSNAMVENVYYLVVAQGADDRRLERTLNRLA